MDPDHVNSGTEITGSNRESIYCLLHLSYSVVLICFYLYDTWLVYYSLEEYADMAWVDGVFAVTVP